MVILWYIIVIWYTYILALVSFVLAQGLTAPCIDPYACLEGGWTGWAGEGMALAGSWQQVSGTRTCYPVPGLKHLFTRDFSFFSTYQTYFHFPKAIFTSGNSLPVVPHKAVAEVSKIDNYSNYRRGELLWCMDGSANPLMDRKVVGVFLEWLQWSTHPQLLNVVWRGLV